MKYLLKTTVLCVIAVFLTVSCKSDFDSLVNQRLNENPLPDPPTANSGDADLSNYVAIGNSLTAGFMDGALYNDGQQNSIPAMLAAKFAQADAPANFSQPDINSPRGFNTAVPQNPVNGTVLGRFKLDTDIPGPSPTLGGDPIAPFTGDPSNLQNFGVPGIVVGQLLTPDTGNPASNAFNPFYARFASSAGTSTILGDAIATQPSFITLWIGSNDVLGYALSGASNPALLTSESDFDTQYNAVIGQLMNNTSANGIAVTIPPVTLNPFFRAVPYNAITLSSTEANDLNQAFAGLNAALDAVAANFPQHSQAEMDARKVSYQAGANPILANDPELDDLEDEFDQLEGAGAITSQQRAALVPYEQSRPLIQGELVTLSAGAVLGTPADPNNPQTTTIGVIIPLGLNSAAQGDEFYLTLAEQGLIQNRTTAFNTIIATAVAQSGGRFTLYDINSGLPGNPNTDIGVIADLFGFDGELGIRVDGVLLQPDFSPNGIFSTDGIHPNQRGNAILANEILDLIESTYNASFPDVDVLALPSVQLCAGDCLSQQSKITP
ncbi:MAG: SGNH/GDSL hydrolase family protein [Balneolaceae bacterium]|nr:SGNH/GDSL hydrolase family protein [Balneolaceae bacterium]